MKNYFLKLSLFITLFSLLTTVVVHAQANGAKFFVSWRSENYVPGWYAGKILPSPGSSVIIGFELIEGDKAVNITQNEIRWFANDVLFQKGFGLKTVKYAIPTTRTSNSQKIKIVVGGYKGADISKFIDIPVASAEVVVPVPYVGGALSPGKHTLSSLLYFWNIRELFATLLEWSYNGTEISSAGNNNSLEIEVPATASGGTLRLSVQATKIGDEATFAKNNAVLLIK